MSNTKTYKVKKGHFDFGSQVSFHLGKTQLIADVVFDKSCLYEEDKERQWNKLVGWSECLLPVTREAHYSASADFKIPGKEYVWGHHYNSVRIAWRANTSKQTIELALYIYRQGVRVIQPLMECRVEEKFRISLTIKEDFNDDTLEVANKRVIAVMSIAEKAVFNTTTSLLGVVNNKKWGYNLFPCFGGKVSAPHDMKLQLKLII